MLCNTSFSGQRFTRSRHPANRAARCAFLNLGKTFLYKGIVSGVENLKRQNEPCGGGGKCVCVWEGSVPVF